MRRIAAVLGNQLAEALVAVNETAGNIDGGTVLLTIRADCGEAEVEVEAKWDLLNLLALSEEP